MNQTGIFRRIYIFAFAFFLVCSCNIFEYSPYEIDCPKKWTSLTNKNCFLISQLKIADSDSFKFALITDSHSDYDELNDAVNNINNNPDISFVIHAGDMTDYGLQEEYKWSVRILDKFKMPFFTVIGNHDCLGNGKHVYNEMFGDPFYSFRIYSNDPALCFKFIFLNDNTLEYDIKNIEIASLMAKIENELLDGTNSYGTFVTAHVMPFSDIYFTDEQEDYFHSLFSRSNVIMFMGGHDHSFMYREYNGDGVMYLRGDDIGDRNYCTVTVYPNLTEISGKPKIKVKRVYY